MTRRFRALPIRFASVAVAFFLPFVIGSLAEAQLKTIVPRLSAAEQERMEAYSNCISCMQNASSGPFTFSLPRLPDPKASTTLNPNTSNLMKNWNAYKKLNRYVNNYFWGNYVLKYTRSSFAQLAKITQEEVQRTRHGISGNRYKGWCKEAVNDILTRSGILDTRIPGDHARQAASYLRNLKDEKGQNQFLDISGSIGGDAMKAPEGAIIVYSGGSSGQSKLKLDHVIAATTARRNRSIAFSLGK